MSREGRLQARGPCTSSWVTEKSFRMSKPDLQARPVYHRKRDSIEHT